MAVTLADVAWNMRVRPQPCSRCGEKVVIVESTSVGFGGLWRLSPRVQVQHADFEPAHGQVDQVDELCRRESRVDQ